MAKGSRRKVQVMVLEQRVYRAVDWVHRSEDFQMDGTSVTWAENGK